MKSSDGNSINDKISIVELFEKLTAKWYYFIISFGILIPLAFAYIYFTPDVYLIRASILLNGGVKNGLHPNGFLKGMELMRSNTDLEDEIGLLKSYSLAESTIRRLNFGITYYAKEGLRSHEPNSNEYPFTIQLDSTVNQLTGVKVYIHKTGDSTFTVNASSKKASTYNFYSNQSHKAVVNVNIHTAGSLNSPIVERNLSFKINFKKGFYYKDDVEYYFIIHNLNSLADAYREQLDIMPVSRESNLVEVNLKVSNPEKGIAMLNTMLEVYRTNELTKKNELGLKTIRFIDNQLGGVSDELRQVESSLQSFRSRNNILDINTTAENLTRNLEKLETDRSVLSQKLKYYQYIANSMDKENNPKNISAPSTFGLEDPILNNLLMELTRLNQERIGLNYSAKEGNPVAEILELKIASAKNSLIMNVNNYIGASSQALGDINSQISEVRRNVQGLPQSERELVSIKRKFDFNDNVYNYLLEKKAEAGIAIASNTVEKEIVDKAKQVGSGPISPNKKYIYLFAVAVSIAFAVGLVIFKDLINDDIILPKDVEQNSNIPFIGSIAHGNKREISTVVVAQGKTAIGESFRSLRVNLQYLTLGNENNIIGVTSSIESEGKTFTSINLAVAMAQSGKRTVLIDCDMRRPKVAALFRLKNDLGLSSFLIGSSPSKDIINSTHIKNLEVITSGPIPPNPLDLIGLPRMDELINRLRQNYNTIIIDSPPMGAVSEYIILMKYTNANIYVVRSNYTKIFHLEKINRLYNEGKIRNVSIVLNDLKTSGNPYGYVYG